MKMSSSSRSSSGNGSKGRKKISTNNLSGSGRAPPPSKKPPPPVLLPHPASGDQEDSSASSSSDRDTTIPDVPHGEDSVSEPGPKQPKDDKEKKIRLSNKKGNRTQIIVLKTTGSKAKKSVSKLALKGKEEDESVEADDEKEEEADDSEEADDEMEDDEDDEDESDCDSEGFEVPAEIEKDELLSQKFEGIKKDIHDDLPTMTEILTTPMRKKSRKVLFEWYHIYQNIMPCSEERMEIRNMIKRLFGEYKKEYRQFKTHRQEILAFEKTDKRENSILDMEYDIIRLETSPENKMVIYRKFKEMREKSEEERDDEYYKLKQWIQWALRVPYDRTKEFPILKTDPGALTGFLKTLRKELDVALYGMNDVKDQIMLFVHHKMIHPEMKGCSLGLVGEPGVGKTSIARCLAKVMEFPFEQISFGGIRTTEHLKGFDYTYVGSQPGEIVKCLSRMKYKNGILFLDEYEKVSENPDINAFLLHMTDFSQNHQFRDNYLCDLSLDLSCLWLIYSMNQVPSDKALRDRIFTIKVSGYSLKEKISILQNFILPKHVTTQKLPETSITIDEENASYLIQYVGGNEKGIRRLEQFIKDLVFKITFLVHHRDELNVGFKYPSQLDYPLKITRSIIENFGKNGMFKDNDGVYQSMYV